MCIEMMNFLSGKITAHNSESDNSIELMCARLLYAGGNDTFTDWLREAWNSKTELLQEV